MRVARRTTVLLATLAALVALVGVDAVREGGIFDGAGQQSIESVVRADGSASTGDADGREKAGRFALPERAPLGESRGDPFGSQSWQPPQPAVAVAPAPPPKPVAPPMPYKFAGRMVRDGAAHYYLAKGESVTAIYEGDVLDGNYRVDSINDKQITVTYLPLKEKQTIAVFSALPPAESTAPPAQRQAAPASSSSGVTVAQSGAPSSDSAPIPTSTVIVIDGRAQSQPAQLLWDGPAKVKLGSRFEVTLKVTSGQPLQASPMQLRFDPAHLQFVTAKPGKLFESGDRKFSYRVNPDGSIFVGASSQNPVPVSDAELIVLVFRPVKPAPAAELSVSSLSLQGPAGRPIIASQPQAFKTVITP